MKSLNRNTICRSLGAVFALGLIATPALGDDGPVKVRRIPTLGKDAGATEKEGELEQPTKRKAEPEREDRARAPIPEFNEGLEVKKAESAGKGEKVSAAELAIRASETAKARALKPAVKRKPKRSGGAVSWTQRYELGPGDTLNFGLFEKPKLEKLKVPVAPDWTISYLQAKQVSVRGLTVEELRIRMEEELSKHRRNPKLIVTPAELGSKRYTVIGKVKENNVFKLDRPTRLLEAIARAKGIVVGTRGDDAMELADLKRSFVMRRGKKLPIDIESLYRTGAMEHNVFIEPGDYIYIASNVHNETYIFGSVLKPERFR